MTQEIAQIKSPPNFEVAVETFARTGSVMRTARRSGATPEQVEEWLGDKRFIKMVAAEQKNLESSTLFEIFQGTPAAVRFLERAMRSNRKIKYLPARVNAARTLIEFWFRAQEFFALRRELDEVKRQLAAQGASFVVEGALSDDGPTDDAEETEE